MSDARPTRAEARLLQIERIKSTSRRLMAEKGAAGLSLREVSREMGVVSSALYRYFATRDDLLTALIVDAYNDLGEFAERAALRVPRADSRRRLHAAAVGHSQVGQDQSQRVRPALRLSGSRVRSAAVHRGAGRARRLGPRFDRGRRVATVQRRRRGAARR